MCPSAPQPASRCTHRSVTDDGRLLCDAIAGAGAVADADREVTPEVCQACPAAAADCPSLRFSLSKEPGAGILVRYGNGRSMLLDQGPATLRLRHAACRVKAHAISSMEECAACSLRHAGAASGANPKIVLFPGLRAGS